VEIELVEFEVDGGHLTGSWGPPLSGTAGYPLIVLATGDGPNGSKGQTWRQLVPMIAARGMGSFLFDFAGLGHSPGTYRDLTLTRGCRDFRAVMKFLGETGDHDRSRIGVIGSSFGGNVALLEAAQFPQIRAVGLKSASTFMPEGYAIELGEEKMAKWAKDNYLEETDHTYDIVLDSLFHNTYAAASRINAPVRIVHGTSDSAVPIRHARDLLKVLPNGSIFEIENADHWYANGDEWQRMASNILDFMVDTLQPQRSVAQ